MLLHLGFAHAQPIVLAGVALLTFAAGLLLGSRLDDDTETSQASSPDADH